MVSEFEEFRYHKIKRGFLRGKEFFPLSLWCLVYRKGETVLMVHRDAMRGKPWVSHIEYFMQKYGIVFVTVGKEKEAKRIARIVVKEKLAACVNLIGPIQSYYKWKGKLVEDKEVLLIIKTKSILFNNLRNRIISLHSYEVPEIILIPIQKGLKSYLDWIKFSLRFQSNLK